MSNKELLAQLAFLGGVTVGFSIITGLFLAYVGIPVAVAIYFGG